jgi:hypothetical protein
MPRPKSKTLEKPNANIKVELNNSVLPQYGFGTGTLGPLGGPSKIQTNELPTETELLELITTLIEPESWSRKDVYTRAVAGRIIIRHEESVHLQIKRLAFRLGLGTFHEYRSQGW